MTRGCSQAWMSMCTSAFPVRTPITGFDVCRLADIDLIPGIEDVLSGTSSTCKLCHGDIPKQVKPQRTCLLPCLIDFRFLAALTQPHRPPGMGTPLRIGAAWPYHVPRSFAQDFCSSFSSDLTSLGVLFSCTGVGGRDRGTESRTGDTKIGARTAAVGDGRSWPPSPDRYMNDSI
jgi:hypothetical protein